MSDEGIEFDDYIEPEKYPLDVEKLDKGDYIAPETCEDITREQRKTDAYRFKLLTLRDWIENERRTLGDPIHLAIRKDGLQILTDEEDVEYRERQEQRGVRTIGLALAKGREIDVTKLSEGARSKLDAQQCRIALRISAMRKAIRQQLPPPKEEPDEKD